MRKNLLICYDTPSTKRRNKIAALLDGYGYRVNYSVFEVSANDTKLKKLETELAKLMNQKEDSLRIYHICENCLMKSKVLCDEIEPFIPRDAIFL